MFGGIYSLMGFVILFFCFVDRTELRQHCPPVAEHESPASTCKFEWTVVALLSLFVLVDCIFEGAIGNCLTAYVLSYSELNIKKIESLYLLSLFWATYTIGRFSTVFISVFFKPRTILVLFHGVTATGTGILFLLVFPAFAGRTTVWIATGIMGFGVSTLYPTGFTWAVRFIHLKYTHMSVLLVAAYTGAFLPTYLVAPFVESSKTVLPSVSLGCVVALICTLFMMLFTTRNRSPIYASEDERNLTALDRETEDGGSFHNEK